MTIFCSYKQEFLSLAKKKKKPMTGDKAKQTKRQQASDSEDESDWV